MTRKNNSYVILLLFVLLNPLIVFASDVDEKDIVLHFDQPQGKISEFKFKQEEVIKPTPNDFKLIDASFMSNNIGERWAIVTIENTSPGRRFFRNNNIVATFANGSQSKADGLDETIGAGTRLTKAIFFGFHKFPIVRVEVGKKVKR